MVHFARHRTGAIATNSCSADIQVGSQNLTPCACISPVGEARNLPIPYPPDHLIVFLLLIFFVLAGWRRCRAIVHLTGRASTPDVHTFGLDATDGLCLALRRSLRASGLLKERLQYALQRPRQVLPRDPRRMLEASWRAKKNMRLSRG